MKSRREWDADDLARELMRRLSGLGNFDEFRDHRGTDGLSDEVAHVIADFLVEECGISAESEAAAALAGAPPPLETPRA